MTDSAVVQSLVSHSPQKAERHHTPQKAKRHDTPQKAKRSHTPQKAKGQATVVSKIAIGTKFGVSRYRIGHLTRNRKAGPGWISYLRMVAFHTNFSITNPNFLLTCKSQPAFLIAHFLVRYPVL